VINLTNKYINSHISLWVICVSSSFATLINKCQGSKLQGKAPSVKMLRPPRFLLPCKITKVSGWNVQQKWISLTGYYIVVSIFPSQTTIGGQISQEWTGHKNLLWLTKQLNAQLTFKNLRWQHVHTKKIYTSSCVNNQTKKDDVTSCFIKQVYL